MAEIRRGEAVDPSRPKIFRDPLWAVGIDWKTVKEDIGYKHPLKFICKLKADG